MVNGKLSEVGKWPWQVNILFLGVYVCSGSLIHQRWALTAAHCFHRSKDPDQYSLKVGIQHLSENGTQVLITDIMIHENFSNLMSEDIALLKLKDSILWSPLIQPICLPSPKYKPVVGALCWVVGWKYGHPGVTQEINGSLQEIAVKIVSNDICRHRYQYLFLKNQKQFAGRDILCARAEWGVDSCQMNSGSSLVCLVNKTWIQMGVVSWTFSCNQHRFPGVYTSTSFFTNWVKKQIGDMRFIKAGAAFLSPLFLTGYILLVSLGSLWLL